MRIAITWTIETEETPSLSSVVDFVSRFPAKTVGLQINNITKIRTPSEKSTKRKKKTLSSTRSKAIMALASQKSTFSNEDVLKLGLGLTRPQCNNYLISLVRSGWLVRLDTGKYAANSG